MIREGKPVIVPRDQWRALRAEDQFDAVLYPGLQPSAMVPVSPVRCADVADVEMQLQRMALAGLPPPEFDRVKRACAAVLVK
jgi:hypothetical protein